MSKPKYLVTSEESTQLRAIIKHLYGTRTDQAIAELIAQDMFTKLGQDSDKLKTCSRAIKDDLILHLNKIEKPSFEISKLNLDRIKIAFSLYFEVETKNTTSKKLTDDEKSFVIGLGSNIRVDAIESNSPNFKLTDWFDEKTFPNELQGAKYYFFERYGDDSKLSDEWGITVGTIAFEHSPKKYKIGFLPVIMNAKNREGNEICLTGIASTCKNRVYLYLDLINESNMRSTITLKYSIEDNSQILVGQDCYNKDLTLQTKSIILIKEEYLKQEERVFGMINYRDPNYRKIPQSIRHYMFDRTLNRLSTQKNIYNLKLFSKFVRDTDEYKYSKFIKDNFCGKFNIYYKKDNQKELSIKNDTLSIYFDEDANRIFAEYLHRTEAGFSKTYFGDVFYSKEKRQIILELSNSKKAHQKKKKRELREIEDPILLSFVVPNDAIAYSAAECFNALLSGLANIDNVGVAYVCLVVRNEYISDDEMFTSYIENFFKSQTYGTMLQPTTNNYFTLKDYLK